MQRLLEIMRRLRAPDGCPWDREQTHLSLRPYLLEEAAEAVDAISAGEPAQVADELGDVLLQVAFHAVIAEEAGTFSYETVEAAITDKLVRRHPHVFGEVRATTAAAVLETWQALKAKEGRAPAEVPSGLPALMRAQELGRKRGWPAASADELGAALAALGEAPPDEAERAVGELLLCVADLARGLEVDAELALREAARQRALLDPATGA